MSSRLAFSVPDGLPQPNSSVLFDVSNFIDFEEILLANTVPRLEWIGMLLSWVKHSDLAILSCLKAEIISWFWSEAKDFKEIKFVPVESIVNFSERFQWLASKAIKNIDSVEIRDHFRPKLPNHLKEKLLIEALEETPVLKASNLWLLVWKICCNQLRLQISLKWKKIFNPYLIMCFFADNANNLSISWKIEKKSARCGCAQQLLPRDSESARPGLFI